ncbi:hypothetical protein DPMN_152949 [Dreissena polymorpha]|uniref:Uncharacterized protein n=1 Tax=Dreissena polymorpha TaxID=45954 RepID=A0A9D4J8V5_DREPO|nr:hypothetical protein DPMN_152949 [Dreissena polymorpha]
MAVGILWRKQYQTQAKCRVTNSKSSQLYCIHDPGTRINLLSANFRCQQSMCFTCQDAELSIQTARGIARRQGFE